MELENAIRSFASQPLSQQVLLNLLKGYKWPHNKINQLAKKGILIPVKRGLYVAGPGFNGVKPAPALLANHIYGPSYVSLEAALAHWRLIPEKVAVITSMTTGLSKSFRTPVGRFRYIHARLPYYSFGIRQVELAPEQTVLMASPEKALCDTLVAKAGITLRSMSQTKEWLMEDLRIDRSALTALDTRAIRSWVDQAPKKTSVQRLIKTLEQL